MARREIPLNERLRDSNPKINENFTELYDGLSEPVLWDEIEGKPEEYPPASHEHEVATQEEAGFMPSEDRATLESGVAPALFPAINLLNDSGRFGGKVNPLSSSLNAVFSNHGFFSSWNGTTVSEAGKFIFNNSTNGGPSGALNQETQDLLQAMGRSGAGARYGIEFYLSRYAMGSSTQSVLYASDGVERYRATRNGARAVFGFGGLATLVFWYRAYGGTQAILGARSPESVEHTGVWKNGEYVGRDAIVSPSEGWVHVRCVDYSSVGYSDGWPDFGARDGDSFVLALPAVFPGPVQPGVHTSPIATINELMN